MEGSAVGGTKRLPRSETPDLHGAFPRLSDAQLDALAVRGQRRSTSPGEVLYREGERDCDFFAIVAGTVTMVDGYGGPAERVHFVHGPGRFLGELGLLTGRPAFLTALAGDHGEVVAVPLERLKQLVAGDPALGDLILRAYLLRGSLLIEAGVGVRLVGSRYSPDARRLREFLARNRVPHTWTDLERDHTAEGLLRQLGVSPHETPVVIWHGTQVLRNPSVEELARTIGLPVPTSDEVVWDLAIIGAGPAGLAAAVYGASEGLGTLALDGVATGGQAETSSRIENYLGFPAGLSGAELADRAVVQAEKFGGGGGGGGRGAGGGGGAAPPRGRLAARAVVQGEKFGARFSLGAEATALEELDGHRLVRLADGRAIRARSVLIATGARYRRLDVPRLEEFEGSSVYYAATEIEARMCRNDPVVVVGGGNSAGQAAVFLAAHAAKVRLLIRHGDLGRDMSRYLVDQIERTPGIEVLRHTEVRELLGDDSLEAVVVEDNRTGERRRLDARSLFVFIGAEPHARWLADQLALDDRGFILTGADTRTEADDPLWLAAGRQPLPLETNRPGVFVAGDVRSGSIKRVASAVGEGAMAVQLVHEYLERVGGDAAGRVAPVDRR
jgi:thioredoxin reductase (NADPH)